MHEGIEQVLAERGARYGDFESHANITQALKDIMRETPRWEELAYDQKEALDMVAHKVGRILNGDPTYLDSWVDIEGFIHLVTRRMKVEQGIAIG